MIPFLKFFKFNQKANIGYVSLTLLTTGIRFFKGFVLMKFLSFQDLGIITLISAVMGLFSLLQFGFLNGGYRIYSAHPTTSKSVDEIIYSYFLSITLLMGLITVILLFTEQLTGTEFIYAIMALIFGLILILNNWIRNRYIATGKLKTVNYLNLFSTLISMSLLITIPYWGLYGALLVTFSIELLFYVFAVFFDKELLPKKLNFKLNEWKGILKFGFIPFLSGVILIINTQVETWGIAKFISTEALGQFYLPKLYITLFMILPTAYSQLFFPKAVNFFSRKEFLKFKNLMKKYFFLNLGTGIFIFIVTYFLLTPIVTGLVPKHTLGIQYVWIIIPGLLLYLIFQPINLIYYASDILKPMLFSSIIAVSFTTICLLGLGLFGELSLFTVSLIKCIYYGVLVISSMGFILVYMRKLKSKYQEV